MVVSKHAQLELLNQILRQIKQCHDVCTFVNHESTLKKVVKFLEATVGPHSSPSPEAGRWNLITSKGGFRASQTTHRWSSRDTSQPHMLVITDLSDKDANSSAFTDYKIVINFDFPEVDSITVYRARSLMDHRGIKHLTCISLARPQDSRMIKMVQQNLEVEGQSMEILPGNVHADILNRCVGPSPFC